MEKPGSESGTNEVLLISTLSRLSRRAEDAETQGSGSWASHSHLRLLDEGRLLPAPLPPRLPQPSPTLSVQNLTFWTDPSNGLPGSLCLPPMCLAWLGRPSAPWTPGARPPWDCVQLAAGENRLLPLRGQQQAPPIHSPCQPELSKLQVTESQLASREKNFFIGSRD